MHVVLWLMIFTFDYNLLCFDLFFNSPLATNVVAAHARRTYAPQQHPSECENDFLLKPVREFATTVI